MLAYLRHGLIQVVCCCFCGWGGILLLDVLRGDNHACCQGLQGCVQGSLHILLVACSDVDVLMLCFAMVMWLCSPQTLAN